MCCGLLHLVDMGELVHLRVWFLYERTPFLPCLCTTLTLQCDICLCLRLGVLSGLCVGPRACPKEVVHLSICMRSLCGTMKGLIPVQLWSQTGSPVTPQKNRRDRLGEKTRQFGSNRYSHQHATAFQHQRRGGGRDLEEENMP